MASLRALMGGSTGSRRAAANRTATLSSWPPWTRSSWDESVRDRLVVPQWPYGTKPVIVLSSSPATLEAPPGAMCTFMAATPAEVIDRLAALGMGHLYIDGGVTIQRFLTAGLIQRLIITRVPVVLGTGIPLFGPVAHDLRFAHVATRAFPTGLVQSEYVVAA